MKPGDIQALVLRNEAQTLLPIAGAPSLSNASGELLREIQTLDEYGDQHSIHVPIERPLTVFVDDCELVTLWTLGACPEWLVLGYLRNQRLLGNVTELESIAVDWQASSARVTTRRAAAGVGSGTVAESFGRKGAAVLATGASLAGVDTFAPVLVPERFSRSRLLCVLEIVKQYDAVYRSSGSVHGCALFHGVDLWVSVEDTSRRNAMDIIAGWMALHGVSGSGKVLFTTGRLTAEMVMKAVSSGVPTVVSRKGMTAACCELAAKFGMILFGHAANRHYVCYAGAERFDAQE